MTLTAGKHLFAELEAIAAHAVEIRHDLHRHPELAYQEVYTSGVVCRELDRLGIEYKKGLAGGTGVLGVIRGTANGAATGVGGGGATGGEKCVALRADMDALPIEEKTGLPYASERLGLMHACGHDGHTAVLL